jgi:hypothetical protein
MEDRVLPQAIAVLLAATASSLDGSLVTESFAIRSAMQLARPGSTESVTCATAPRLRLDIATGAGPSFPVEAPLLWSKSQVRARRAVAVPPPNAPSMP